MLCFKLSPSSISTFLGCQQKYFIKEVLNYRGSSGVAAALGTTLHRIMEILAKAKLEHQNTKNEKVLVQDDTIGKYEFNISEWDKISNIKIGNKEYKIRGAKEVKDIFDLVFVYYSNLYNEQNWGETERDKLRLWIHIALSEKNQLFDPRTRKVFQPEKRLSYKIEEEWGAYNYGSGVEGYVNLNGIVDIIYEGEDGTYHLVDYKSGSRKDFHTGVLKDNSNLRNDIQLMSYYYLMTKLYPEITNLTLTIFFIRDGGDFTPFFCRDDIPRIEAKLKEHYSNISQCTIPKLLNDRQADFRCKKFCDFSKISLDGTNLCRAVADRIKRDGINRVTEELRQ